MKNLTFLFLLVFSISFSQTSEEQQLKKFYDTSLLNGQSYDWLDYLSNRIGSRLSGSVGAELAVKYTKEELDKLGLDKVWLQPVMVPKWVRGAKEYAYIKSSTGNTNLPVCALGGSVATPALGITAEVIEVKNFEELKELGEAKIKGKIVFYNRPMQADLIQTFNAYGGCVDQRVHGAKEAVKYGAVAVLVRSMNLRLDDLPHTGTMSYDDLPDSEKIPAAAISTNAAELLSTMVKLTPDLKVHFKQSCENKGEVQSYNVIGEIKGSEKPDEIMVVGGHLDSWDLGDGSHDDGAGVVQSMEVLRLMKETGYKPKHTVRVVLFMNEENGLRGGLKYADVAKNKKEKHLFALESDAGGFSPRGFSFDCTDEQFETIANWSILFKPYLIHYFEKGGSGADVGPLKADGVILAGLRPDSQRYFDYHHAANDRFDAVNKRELELGAATMASLLYLIDQNF
ncbi:PA domain-containing protein [Pustulibacterium marinum]|uniref:Carboxypeptidase Q n=1 Tax=Pustulibacterium marinum TaxID=1224947 RepID=A0A1I7FDA0_9FLAO|nr:M20/M25/M40 family metallo-hydrolase [Pustulibacterium marinum]SFU34190.1 PA domain-containing protein [Pustulibacterium marinum]